MGGTSFDVAYSIIHTRDGKFIVAGETNSNDGDVSGLHINSFHSDAWVVMMDSVGNILLQRCLGGTNSENANSVIEVADGDYVIAGNTNSIDGDVSGGGAHGGNDAWIVKLDAGLNIVWQKSLGGSLDDVANSVIQTLDGKYVLAGSTNSTNGDVNGLHTNSSNPDAWIVNLDTGGAIIWQKCLGGSGNDVARSVIQSKDSNS